MQEKLFRTEEENKLMNQHHEATRQLEYKHMKVNFMALGFKFLIGHV